MSEQANLLKPARPYILKATDDLVSELQNAGRLHAAALKSGEQWRAIHECVRLARSAGSIKVYMESLLKTTPWTGSEELRKNLHLYLTEGSYACWQLIAKEVPSGVSYYVFPTLRDLIEDGEHWGLGLSVDELKAYVEPDEPDLWARIQGALDFAPTAGHNRHQSYDSRKSTRTRGDVLKEARARELARAMQDSKVADLYREKMIPANTARAFGVINESDPDIAATKQQCLDTAHKILTDERQRIEALPREEKRKATSKAKGKIKAALAPVSKPQTYRKSLGSPQRNDWVKSAAEQLLSDYSPFELGQLIEELLLRNIDIPSTANPDLH